MPGPWEQYQKTDEAPVESGPWESYAQKAVPELKGFGQSVAKGVGNVLETVDEFNPAGAALRAGLAAKMNGGEFGSAYAGQYGKGGGPTAKDLAVQLGINDTSKIDLPIISDPFTGKKVQMSAADAAGTAFQTATDPMTYVGGVGAGKGAGLLGKEALAGMSPKVAEYLMEKASERAVKAGTGQSVKAMRKIARVSPNGAGDINAAIGRLQNAGRSMLTADEAGAPIVGWFDSTPNIATKAADKQKFFGKQIGDVGSTVDELMGGSYKPVIGPEVASEVEAYANKIPKAGEGAAVKGRLESEVENLKDLGGMSFKEAQNLKQQYPFKPQAADALISSQDATNKIRGVITDKMDNAVQMSKLTPGVTPEQVDVLNKYGLAKDKYGIYKDISDAGTDRSLGNLSNRFVSPSDYAAGAIGSLASAAKGENASMSGLKGFVFGLANKVARERGSSFSANALKNLSQGIEAAGPAIAKWEPALKAGAILGGESLLVRHNLLMQSDPEYRQIMTQSMGGQP